MDELFAGGGEMGALMRATDWSKTKLGPVEKWPQSLRTMVGVILGSRFPMLLWWGPDLLHLYNDAYRPILRDKHPASLAAPAAEIWAEVWDVAGPMARSVQEGGPATWTEDLQLFIKSGDIAEETYFTFSYSPVPGDDGRVGGLLNTVQETTVKVQGERQIRMLHDLAARAAEATSEVEAYRIAAEVLGANTLDLPFVQFYGFDEASGGAHLVAARGREKTESSWPVARVINTRQEVIVDSPERAILLPLTRAVMVAGLSPHRVLDDRYRRLFQVTADRVASVVVNARAYEAEKKRAEALAEVDRAKTAFFSNVSHEFRTPLTLILGPVEDALARPSPLLQGESLNAIHRSALRLLRLVNSLLDFARIEAGRMRLSLVPTDLATLTTDLASSFRSLIERAGLTLRVDSPPLAEPVAVDPAHWEKIVLNLISNAFKFTFQGEISVRLRGGSDQVTLTVSDTGTGISASELPRIFERFHRVEGAQGRSFEGTGIGLSLVQELVRLHGGSVRVESVEGIGSTFEVSIPARADVARHAPGRAAPPPVTTAVAPYLLEAGQWIGASVGLETFDASAIPIQDTVIDDSSRTDRARILIADDNADMRDYLVRLLSSRWRVEVVEDGAAALAAARHAPPDLVLSDVMMPKLDGVALLRELRALPETSQIPVVLLSARAGEEAMLAGLETGADDYLVKPFSARELLARVHTHLELARLRREWANELQRVNRELEAFSYSVSHDLRAPLRAIDGFSAALEREYAARLDEQGRGYLGRVRAAATRMGQLIEDLLNLSRITRATLRRERCDMTTIARKVLAELQEHEPQRRVSSRVADGLVVEGDPRLLTVMLENLLRNAWKFTRKQPAAMIEVGTMEAGSEAILFVRDNGAGFNMDSAQRLFAPFQRLHAESEFDGTGIGLATVQRVLARHGGRVWAEAEPGKGATFFFTVPSP